MSEKVRSDELSTQQAKAVAALLSTRTLEEAASQAEVTPRTLLRWRRESAPFRKALREARSEVVEQAAARLQANMATAADVLAEVATDPEASRSDLLWSGGAL